LFQGRWLVPHSILGVPWQPKLSGALRAVAFDCLACVLQSQDEGLHWNREQQERCWLCQQLLYL
jgi:hypothetical protein